MCLAGAKGVNVDIVDGFGFEAFVMDAAGREGSLVGKSGKQAFNKVWLNLVVAIHETKIFALSFFEADVSGGGLALVFLVNDFNARIFFSVVVGDLAGSIGGAVVDQNDF